MLIEVLIIYSNRALGRKLRKSLKITKGHGHNTDETGHSHPQFKACFSTVTHGNGTQTGFQNSLKSNVHHYRWFHEDTMKGTSSDHTAKLPQFYFTHFFILNSKFYCQPRLLWSLSLPLKTIYLLGLSGFLPPFSVSHFVILLPESFLFLILCLHVHFILNILMAFSKIFQICISKYYAG